MGRGSAGPGGEGLHPAETETREGSGTHTLNAPKKPGSLRPGGGYPSALPSALPLPLSPGTHLAFRKGGRGAIQGVGQTAVCVGQRPTRRLGSKPTPRLQLCGPTSLSSLSFPRPCEAAAC